MKRELGIARCGLACCLCSENEHCRGCNSGDCPDKDWCENRSCSISMNIENCYLCQKDCRKGLLSKIKPYGFTVFAKRYGVEALLDCLEQNERNGIVYHRQGIVGDYDDFDDVEKLIKFIKTGRFTEESKMFRKSTTEDCKWVYELICELECKELPFDRFSAIYNAQVEDSKYYCLVCERDDKIVGVLNLRFEEQLHHSDRIAEVLEFSVSPACRSQGIGKEMFAVACRIAKEFGCSQIELATNQLRTDAHRFYEREGMRNFHYKYSMSLTGETPCENIIGR